MKLLRSVVSVPVMLGVICALALAEQVTEGSGKVTDLTGTVIGDFTTQGSGEYFDFSDNPSQNHPPNTDAVLAWDIPGLGDPYTDVTDGSAPFEYDVVFTLTGFTACTDGWKKKYKWEKKDRSTGQTVDAGYLLVPC